MGGVQFMVQSLGSICQRLPFFDHWYWVLAYPGLKFPLQRREQFCRRVIPVRTLCSRQTFGWLCTLATHQENLAAIMMKDVIAEPYRQQLLPNFAEVKQAAQDLGAWLPAFQVPARQCSPLPRI